MENTFETEKENIPSDGCSNSGTVATFKVFFYLQFLRSKFISQHALLE